MSKANIILLASRILALLIAITGAVGLGWATAQLSSPDSGPVYEQIGYISLAVSGFWSLVSIAAALFYRDRGHRFPFIAGDLISGLFTVAGGICVVLSPFAKASWIECNEERSTSICNDPAEKRAVIWRFVAAAFCFLNALLHLAAIILVLKTPRKDERNDVEQKN
ncbi:hypothetical protein VTO42DRAFT_5003 [Malbranchea cinnamomea]